ncbi:MAG: iron chelate uptake ABC transporter family permease subunit [Myxococcota bacterium]|nr:iron chelate uptake ABC transporter family permease subunit [Myxococcota bacterium]
MPERIVSSPAVPAAGVAMAALALGSVGLLLSFRVPFGSLDPAFAAHLDRLLAAAAAGLALAAAGALRERTGESAPLREPLWFALSTGAAGGFVLGASLWETPAAGWLLALVGGGVSALLVAALDRSGRAWNLALGFVLATMGIAAVPTVLVAATLGAAGGPAFWLLGDVSHAAGLGAPLVLGLSALGCGAAATVASAARLGERTELARTTAVLLLGLGIGIAGPIAFVAWFAPWVVRSVSPALSAAAQVALAGLVGAGSMMAADSIPRALIGGYAPPLNLCIGLVAIPTFLFWNRARLARSAPCRAGFAFEAIELLVLFAATGFFAWLTFAVTGYARSAA